MEKCNPCRPKTQLGKNVYYILFKTLYFSDPV